MLITLYDYSNQNDRGEYIDWKNIAIETVHGYEAILLAQRNMLITRSDNSGKQSTTHRLEEYWFNTFSYRRWQKQKDIDGP